MAIRDLIPWKSQGQDIAPRQEERVDHPVMSLHRDINRLFDDMFRAFSMPSLPSIGRSLGWPRVELSENDKEIRVMAELPGMEEKDIEISLDDHQLVIRGEKKSETSDEERGYSERSYGRFERRIGLPSQIDEDKVEAAFRNGVLTVRIPRTSEAAKGRKTIPINAS